MAAKWILFLITGAFSATLATATHAGPKSTPEANIKILAEEMDCDQKRQVCIAKINAIAEKLNDPEKKILKSDMITAHFTKKPHTTGEEASTKITRLEANGHVFLILGEVIVQGDHGTYDLDSETAEIFDDVKITHGKSQLNGSYGKVNMKTGQYSVKRNGERVEALLFTQDESLKKSKKNNAE